MVSHTAIVLWGVDNMTRKWAWLWFVGVTAACAPTAPSTETDNPATHAQLYSQMETARLWYVYSTTTAPRELLFVEAELGVRGETSSGGAYIGQRTSGTVGRSLYARPGLAQPLDDRNCPGFASAAEAQRFFLSAGGPVSDPHGLDRDGDGNACEWGTTLKASATRNRPRPAPVAYSAPRSSSTTCYVGPRGGTYTITASGNKNYGGC